MATDTVIGVKIEAVLLVAVWIVTNSRVAVNIQRLPFGSAGTFIASFLICLNQSYQIDGLIINVEIPNNLIAQSGVIRFVIALIPDSVGRCL